MTCCPDLQVGDMKTQPPTMGFSRFSQDNIRENAHTPYILSPLDAIQHTEGTAKTGTRKQHVSDDVALSHTEGESPSWSDISLFPLNFNSPAAKPGS